MIKKESVFDVFIVGGGAAGLTAALYAARYNLKTMVISESFGGLGSEAHRICNYPGVAESGGFELMNRFRENASSAGAKLEQGMVTDIVKEGVLFKISTKKGEYYAKAIVLAIGTKRRKLGLKKEADYLGKGVSYCFTCDGMFFKGKTVGVVGGSDAAVTAALYFSEISPEIYLIYRGDKLRAEPAWLKNLEKKKNIEVLHNTNVVDLYGEGKLEGVVLDKTHRDKDRLSLDGLFVEIGEIPNEELVKPLGLKIDEKGFVVVDEHSRTNIGGIWAAGDFTTGSGGLRQIVTAAAEGAIAANDVFNYLKKEEGK